MKLNDIEKKSDLCIKVSNFNLKYTLECGQCFRWKKVDDINNEYIGIISDRVIKIWQKKEYLYVCSNKIENLEYKIMQYFDLNTDYSLIEEKIASIDNNINLAVKNTSGIRILKQDPFETLISYIISANNNIPRISRSVNDISRKYGTRVFFDNNEFFLFPTIEQLADITTEEFQKCGVGFRARYIKHTIEEILNNRINLRELDLFDDFEIRDKLLKFQGVGPKVADCILLFAYSRKNTFPVDVWVKRVMENLYFRKNVSLKEIIEYSNKNFGEYSGIVQQHLFYNVRENLI
ncbi:MAG: 8-oxoguanine DNA glycosylase [Clostridia bacterium]|nr:8-oxoguanine DNA glycosylase [Clostridia bacterium]